MKILVICRFKSSYNQLKKYVLKFVFIFNGAVLFLLLNLVTCVDQAICNLMSPPYD